MEIYMFDGETKEYIGAEDALLDPLETKKQGKPVYLLPANAVFDRAPMFSSNRMPLARSFSRLNVICHELTLIISL